MAAALTLRAALREAISILRKAGVATPDLDARVLAAHATGRDSAQLIASSGEPLDACGQAKFAAAIARRSGGEPVARILGRREFWGRDFLLNDATLVPRPDSETIVEAALEAVDAGAGRSAPLRIVDLGTGSGCLLVALLMELPASFGVGIDISAEAVDAARQNAKAHGVGTRATFAVGDWAEPLAAKADVIVANPPYIPAGAIDTLSAEVAWHEPRTALDGGEDGLDSYRRLLSSATTILASGGVLVLEHGLGQQGSLVELIERSGLALRGERHDLSGIARAMVAVRPSVSTVT